MSTLFDFMVRTEKLKDLFEWIRKKDKGIESTYLPGFASRGPTFFPGGLE